MSTRFDFERLAVRRRKAQQLVEHAQDEKDHAPALLAVEDVNVAKRSLAS